MADIRIRDLPTASPPVSTDFVAIDNGTTRKTDIQTLVETGRPAASQAEAEAGTDPAKVMTPLTTKQAVDFYGLTKSGNLAGLTNTVTARSNLGLGSAAVESASAFQPADAALTSIAGLTTGADQMIYTTALDTYATTSLTPFARTVLDDVSGSAARTTLGVAIGSNVQAWSANLDELATINAGTIGKDLLADETALDARTTLGLDAVYLRITSDPLKEFIRLGMVPNDLGSAASNATLLNTALGEIPATGGGLLINFGNFYIADISAMPTARPLSVRGQGRGASIMTPTQVTGTFLEFSQTDYTDTVHFSDFTMQFETAALCRAMSITYPAADATNNQMPSRVSGVNVDIRGLNAALHGPKSGIDLINVTGADFARVNIGGRQDTSLVGENQFFSNEYGWKMTAPSAGTPTLHKWDQCKVFAAINAWDVADLHEGLHWQDCEAVAVGRGIRVNLSADRPGFYIGKTHIAAFRECIIFNGVAQSQVVNNHLYIREDASVTPGRCVFITNGNSNIVLGNLMQNLSDPNAGGVNGIGVELSNSDLNQVLNNDFGALMEGCKVLGNSANNVYRKGNWHDAVGTGTLLEYQAPSTGTGNIRRGQELDVSNRNSGGAVVVTGGAAAATITSTATDTLEVGDDIVVNFSMVCNKDASAGHVRAIVAKTGTSVIQFDNNLTQLDVEVSCTASQTARLRGTAKGRVTTRGSCTLTLQAFGPVSGFTVPVDGGQIEVARR